ncbi:hypothetical protein HX037_05730 [Ignatzschineria indica]|uniref:hypothetical protein n=1 Tax=Ignatzschineria indica TaxID=472583 RepID=UPI0025752F3E|nr:hypothetical protein [Ignatzschineria indica]MDM1545384.1 hypothetical protein [Ignatzschineria indica]
MKSAEDRLDQSIQRDIFFDFKKLILCYLWGGGIFFFLSITAIFVSDEIKNILLLLLFLFSMVMIVLGCVIISRLKRKEEKYRKYAESVIKKAEQR